MKKNLHLVVLWSSVIATIIIAAIGKDLLWILLPFIAAWISLYLITWPQPAQGVSQHRLDKRRLYHRSGLLWVTIIQILFGGIFQPSPLAWYIEIGALGLLFLWASLNIGRHQVLRFVIGLVIGFPLGTLIARPLMSIFVAALAGTGGKELVSADFFPALAALAFSSAIITKHAHFLSLNIDMKLSGR